MNNASHQFQVYDYGSEIKWEYKPPNADGLIIREHDNGLWSVHLQNGEDLWGDFPTIFNFCKRWKSGITEYNESSSD